MIDGNKDDIIFFVNANQPVCGTRPTPAVLINLYNISSAAALLNPLFSAVKRSPCGWRIWPSRTNSACSGGRTYWTQGAVRNDRDKKKGTSKDT